MMGFIIAVEKAYEFKWDNIWIETDSMYVVHLFNRGTGQISWRFHNRWLSAYKKARTKNFIVTHIFREGNNVADRLASQASNSQDHQWWMHIPEHLASIAYRDHIDLPYYRFSAS